MSDAICTIQENKIQKHNIDKFKNFNAEIINETKNESVFTKFFNGVKDCIESTIDSIKYILEFSRFLDLDDVKHELFVERNGQIEATSQGQTGDCWLLCGVNALNTSPRGQELIKESLDYHFSGTTVHLKGIGDYEVSNKEVKEARTRLELKNGDKNLAHPKANKYSRGDDDMIIFEIAIEKALQDIADNNVVVVDNISYIEKADALYTDSKEDDTSLNGGTPIQAIYFITGKTGEYTFDKKEFQNYLEEFKNNKEIVLGAGTSGSSDKNAVDIVDIEGNTISLANNHAYSIKDVTDDYVSVVNPWDSSKEIKLDYQTFIDSFNSMYHTDLSDNNPVNSVCRKTELDEHGNKTITLDCEEPVYNMLKRKKENYSSIKYVYAQNDRDDSIGTYHSNLAAKVFYDENNQEAYRIEYDKTNEAHIQLEGNGKYEIKSSPEGISISEKDSNGRVIKTVTFDTYKEIIAIYENDLFNNNDLDLSEIIQLAQQNKNKLSWT